MSLAADRAERLDIGAVISDTFKVLQRNLRVFGLAALFLVILPSLVQLLLNILTGGQVLAAQTNWLSQGGPALSIAAIALSLIFTLIGAVCSLSLNAGLFYAAAKDLDGEPVGVRDLILTGLKRFLPLFGLYILMAISVELGMILLIVPGVYIFLRWSAAGPAIAVEGRGVFAAMKRSAMLTKGRKWPLLLLWLIVFALLMAIDLGFVAAMGGFAAAAKFAYTQAMTPAMVVGLVLISLFGIVFSILLGVLGGVVFHHLRAGREDLSMTKMAEVFA